MVSQFENSEIFARLLESTIHVIGRRSSDGYAVVVVNNVLKGLSEKYNFLKNIEIKNIKYSETNDFIDIKSDINNVSPFEIRDAATDFFGKIIVSMGKNAGYFFIKELKEYIGIEYDVALQKMDIDLNQMQFEHFMEKRQQSGADLAKDTATIFKHILGILFDIMHKNVNADFAISTMTRCIDKLKEEYDFLKYISLQNVRHTLGDETIVVSKEINNVKPSVAGKALEKLMVEISESLERKKVHFLSESFKERLNKRYLPNIEEMGIDLNVLQVSNRALLQNVLKVIIDVLSESSSEDYAFSFMDDVLKKSGMRYDFLKDVSIEYTRLSEEGLDAISINRNVEDIDPMMMGKIIQSFLENLVRSLRGDLGRNFIGVFKDNLEKVFLHRLEEMGVNLHMMQLRWNLLMDT